MRTLLMFILLFLATGSIPAAAVDLPYGPGTRQVGFMNATTHPGPMGIPLPIGPSAIRWFEDHLWVLDTVGKKLLQLSPDGKVANSLLVGPAQETSLPVDFAFSRKEEKIAAVWVLDRHQQQVRKYSPTGKLLETLGGLGTAPGQFSDLRRIEVAPSGRAYIGDAGTEKISIFDHQGKLLAQLPWSGNGFAVDSKERVLTLEEKPQGSGNWFLLWRSPKGKSLREKPIPMKAGQAWIADLLPDDSALVTYLPKDSQAGKAQVAVVSIEGTVSATLAVPDMYMMGRSLSTKDKENLWVADGNFDAAPKGSFTIQARPFRP